MGVERRTFLAALGGIPAAAAVPHTVLEAFAAAHMPQRLVIWRQVTSGIVERRAYASPTLHPLMQTIFARVGIRPLQCSTRNGLVYLIPFAGLTERAQAWDAFNADPEWVMASPTEISIFKPVAAPESPRLPTARQPPTPDNCPTRSQTSAPCP